MCLGPPGACLLHGIFYSRERLPVLFPFVREALQNGLPFELRASGGQRLVKGPDPE